MAEQLPFFGTDDFAINPEPRLPCVLLLDVSSSMAGKPIAELNEGLQLYRNELRADELSAKRVEVAIVTFGDEVRTVADFTTAENFQPPTLKADGNTPMGAAINMALAMILQRKVAYRANGIPYFRPWIFLITDGAPTDEWRFAAKKVKEGEEHRAFAFFAVGVTGADLALLAQIASRQPLQLQGLRFRDLFQWLSNSQRSLSQSTPGDQDKVTFINPAGPSGWAAL
jgi:uncharacterized protein YegL